MGTILSCISERQMVWKQQVIHAYSAVSIISCVHDVMYACSDKYIPEYSLTFLISTMIVVSES